jgi:hypothetical protein
MSHLEHQQSGRGDAVIDHTLEMRINSDRLARDICCSKAPAEVGYSPVLEDSVVMVDRTIRRAPLPWPRHHMP